MVAIPMFSKIAKFREKWMTSAWQSRAKLAKERKRVLSTVGRAEGTEAGPGQ